MQPNSFQKNGMLKINSFNNQNNNYNNSEQLGRRTIQDIRDDMWKAKGKKEPVLPKNNENLSTSSLKNGFKQRMDALQNANRWRG